MGHPPIDLNALWSYVTTQVKGKITLPSLWRAMEAAKPIALEDNELVMGFPAMSGHQAGLLTNPQHKNVIEQVLEAATRVRLELRVIDGETLEDWETLKRNREEATRLQEQTRQQLRKQVEQGDSWEAVGESLIRRFSGVPNRGLASVQGRFLEEAIRTVVEAYPRLMPETPDEHDERNYSRTLERISERVNVPAAMISQIVDTRLKKG
jgi:hypothetical protein